MRKELPAWPEKIDAIGPMADWVEDQLPEAYEKFENNRQAEDLLTAKERAMLTAAFENEGGERWAEVAAHLQSDDTTKRFREVISGLIMHNGFTNRANLRRRPEDRFYLRSKLIDDLLREHYPSIAPKKREQRVAELTALLRNSPTPGETDASAIRARREEREKARKIATDKRRHLATIVQRVWDDPIID